MFDSWCLTFDSCNTVDSWWVLDGRVGAQVEWVAEIHSCCGSSHHLLLQFNEKLCSSECSGGGGGGGGCYSERLLRVVLPSCLGHSVEQYTVSRLPAKMKIWVLLLHTSVWHFWKILFFCLLLLIYKYLEVPPRTLCEPEQDGDLHKKLKKYFFLVLLICVNHSSTQDGDLGTSPQANGQCPSMFHRVFFSDQMTAAVILLLVTF